jgi:hypothetical protein
MSDTDPKQVKLTKAMIYARTYGLTRDDRLELAEILLRRDVASWKDLDENQLVRLLDALEGFALVNHLRTTRNRTDPSPPSSTPSHQTSLT